MTTNTKMSLIIIKEISVIKVSKSDTEKFSNYRNLQF